MALDVYVGSLTRYYAGEWESSAEKTARERGVQYQIVRPGGSADRVKHPERIHPAILAWRQSFERVARQQDRGAARLGRDDGGALLHRPARAGTASGRWSCGRPMPSIPGCAGPPACPRNGTTTPLWCAAPPRASARATPTSCAMSSCGCPFPSSSPSKARMSTGGGWWSARPRRCVASSTISTPRHGRRAPPSWRAGAASRRPTMRRSRHNAALRLRGAAGPRPAGRRRAAADETGLLTCYANPSHQMDGRVRRGRRR